MSEIREDAELSVYVRRAFDIILDVNGYPHTEGNRQALYRELTTYLSKEDVEALDALILEDHNFVDNSYSEAVGKAFDDCENNGLFRVFKENEETGEFEEDNLPSECYDIDFFADINSDWPESKIKD